MPSNLAINVAFQKFARILMLLAGLMLAMSGGFAHGAVEHDHVHFTHDGEVDDDHQHFHAPETGDQSNPLLHCGADILPLIGDCSALYRKVRSERLIITAISLTSIIYLLEPPPPKNLF